MKSNRLGPLLRYHRLTNGMLSKDVAFRLGVSKAQYSKIEMGKHDPKGDLALRMIQLLIPSLESFIFELEIEVENNRAK